MKTFIPDNRYISTWFNVQPNKFVLELIKKKWSLNFKLRKIVRNLEDFKKRKLKDETVERG